MKEPFWMNNLIHPFFTLLNLIYFSLNKSQDQNIGYDLYENFIGNFLKA